MKLLLKVSFLTALLTLLRMGFGFVIAKIVAIYSGPTGLAMMGQIQSFISGLNGVVNAAAGNAVVRYTAECGSDGNIAACKPWWVASAQWVALSISLSVVACLVFIDELSLWLFHGSDYNWLLILVICSLPFTAAGTFFSSVINGLRQYKRFIAVSMFSVVVSNCCMIALIYYQKLNGALIAASIQAMLVGLIVCLSCLSQPWLKLKFFFGAIDAFYLRKISGYVLMAVTSAITLPMTIIIIRNLIVSHVGWDGAGNWQAVYKISEVYLSVVTIALSTYYLPALASVVGIDAIKKEIGSVTKVIMPLVIVMAAFIYLGRDFAISVLFTEEFSDARNLFAVQLSGDVIKILSWLYAYPMISRGATKWYVSTEIGFAALYILLASLFIPIWGVQGAVFAYLINYLIYLPFMYFNFNQYAA